MVSNGSKLFRDVESFRPGRSAFDLSADHKFTADLGALVPVYIEDLVPGDYFQMGCKGLVRFNPLVAPIMHAIDATVHFFFIPYRLLWTKNEPWSDVDDWENFITGGPDGTDTSTPPAFVPTGTADTGKYSLWDYFGFPVPEELSTPQTNWYTGWNAAGAVPELCPRIFPWRAYTLVYNEFYRDENLQDPKTLQKQLLYRAWEKDYFTAALPWQQRGTAPGIPVNLSTTASAVFAGLPAIGIKVGGASNDVVRSTLDLETNLKAVTLSGSSGQLAMVSKTRGFSTAGASADDPGYGLNDNEISLSGVGASFSISDLRDTASIQHWMERNARGGVRYTEFLQAHFSIRPEDYRLQRPEYIGGVKFPLLTSEVLQTSSTDSEPTPQGNMAGHGMGVLSDMVGKYRAMEYGMIIGIFSALARPVYQQGIRRNWNKLTRYDYYQPEFAHLSEQPIMTSELYAKGIDTIDTDVFGFQGQYDEYRYKPSIVTSGMRKDFAHWHLAREFESQPLLNESFISAQNTTKRYLAVPSEPALLVDVGFSVTANRPMPYQAIPGLMRV